MKVVANELKDELSQEVELLLSERYTIGCISPYIYIHNAPSGTFKLSIFSGATEVFFKTFTCSDIKTAISSTNNYAHVFYPIIPDNPLQLSSGQYILKLTSSGYTYSKTSFIAWCQQFEDLNNELSYTPLNIAKNPLAFRVKILKRHLTW